MFGGDVVVERLFDGDARVRTGSGVEGVSPERDGFGFRDLLEEDDVWLGPCEALERAW